MNVFWEIFLNSSWRLNNSGKPVDLVNKFRMVMEFIDTGMSGKNCCSGSERLILRSLISFKMAAAVNCSANPVTSKTVLSE